MTGLITMDDLTNEEILSILDDAERLLPVARGELYLPLLQGRIMGNLFFEPSTRTRMSFETSMKRLGGDVINLGDVKTSSVVKGETLFDTIQMVDGYTDIIAMRHNTLKTQLVFLFLTVETVLETIQLKPCWTCSPSAKHTDALMASRLCLQATSAMDEQFTPFLMR